VNRANRDDTGNRTSPALDGDPVPLELLIEEWRHFPWNPAQSEITILADTSHHVPRLVQRTDNQSLCRPTSELKMCIACAVANGSG
jgi:hypothetical protein